MTPERLVEVIRATEGQLKLSSGSALLVRIEATDAEGLVAEFRLVLHKVASAAK